MKEFMQRMFMLNVISELWFLLSKVCSKVKKGIGSTMIFFSSKKEPCKQYNK